MVVFNTPGSNANAVKELVLCGLFLSSRGISEGVGWANSLSISDTGEMDKAVEKGKKNFGGLELTGKTLGVVGLGNIGARVAESALGKSWLAGHRSNADVHVFVSLVHAMKHVK